ncbi:hypothetical protein GCM10028807_58060 [Spirosoma daeguense]
MELQFDVYGNSKQLEVCQHWQDSSVTDIVYGGSKGSGKSYLGCSLIFGDALTYPETFYFIARDSLTNIRKFTIPSIHEVFNHWDLGSEYYVYNGQDNYYTLYNKSRVYLLDAKFLPSDPLYARFGSMQMTRGWIEEAGEFKESAKNNLSASIGRWKNDVYSLAPKLLQTCNPAKNYLYKEYYRKNKETKLEPWRRFVQALPQDNKKLPPGYLENLHRTLSPNEKQRLLYGNWEYDDDPSALIQYDKIIDLWSNKHAPKGQRFITVDAARFGGDNAKIFIWEGWHLLKAYSFPKSSMVMLANEIERLAKYWSVPASNIVIDEDGVGGGCIDILRETKSMHVKGFINNSSPLEEISPEGWIKPNYDNLKSQCSFRLANRTNQGGWFIAPDAMSIEDKQALIEELEQVKQKDMDKDGKKRVIPKEDVKELIGRSPDNSDCAMFREFFELKPKPIAQQVW